MNMWPSQLNRNLSNCEVAQENVCLGFNGIRTRGLCVRAAVLYQLSYEDPYTGGKPIFLVHQLVKGIKHRMKWCKLQECKWNEYVSIAVFACETNRGEFEFKCHLGPCSVHTFNFHVVIHNNNNYNDIITGVTTHPWWEVNWLQSSAVKCYHCFELVAIFCLSMKLYTYNKILERVDKWVIRKLPRLSWGKAQSLSSGNEFSFTCK